MIKLGPTAIVALVGTNEMFSEESIPLLYCTCLEKTREIYEPRSNSKQSPSSSSVSAPVGLEIINCVALRLFVIIAWQFFCEFAILSCWFDVLELSCCKCVQSISLCESTGSTLSYSSLYAFDVP